MIKRVVAGPAFVRALACAPRCRYAPRIAGARIDAARIAPDPAAMLTARYAALKDELHRSQFGRPVYLDSSETKNAVTGEIFALLNHPFAAASAALDTPSEWCDILILHLNTKYCRPSTDSKGTVLHVSIGKKFEQPVSDAYRLDFSYRVGARTANYLQVKLDAAQGPLGTRDYRIVLEATPADDGQTFIRLAYSYSYGFVGQLAMKAYLGTVGRDKVGFTVVGTQSDPRPRPVGGMRGAVERNTMRYYLAIEAFLGALSAPPGARVEKSMRDWFAATEAYPRQLHEVDQNEYLAMKRNEYLRQRGNLD